MFIDFNIQIIFHQYPFPLPLHLVSDIDCVFAQSPTQPAAPAPTLICKLANIQFTQRFISLSANCSCQTAKLILIQNCQARVRFPFTLSVYNPVPWREIWSLVTWATQPGNLLYFKYKACPNRIQVYQRFKQTKDSGELGCHKPRTKHWDKRQFMNSIRGIVHDSNF